MPALSAITAHPGSWSGLLAREDITPEDGMLHLIHETVTPHQARVDDLLFVSSALESAGIEVWLLRTDPGVPALAVDLGSRDLVSDALAQLCTQHPVYVKAKRARPQLASDLPPLPDEPVALRVFRPRITPGGTLRYGARQAVRLEFWRFGDDIVEAPADNVLMRRMTPRADLRPAAIERYGRSWRTIEGMFTPLPHEFTHDVDLVFSWVDGSSSEFQRQRAARMSGHVVGEGDDSPARYRHVDELRYALRSTHMYAPWVRRIFIATDSPAPAWLLDHPKVTLVRSEEFFADPTVLPTHNSHAVEAQLHRIPGLAEHFLYANDDMFFGRPVEPELFFTAAGVTKFVESEVRIGPGARRPHRSGHDNALRLNRDLLQERFGRMIVRDLEHCATPLRRSIMAELEREFPEDFARTAASRFRSATDISVTNSLYHYYALMTGRAVATRRPRTRYIHTTLAASLRRVERMVEGHDLDMFCLNDGAETEVPEDLRAAVVTDTLAKLFPILPPWERPDTTLRPIEPGFSAPASAALSEGRQPIVS
ncbi:stealth family protein [Microbacterium sp.]|uniref:stealth family protein n=1 Tax=Microbacterium sp. TaxID=51671 RepID=UPI0037C72368